MTATTSSGAPALSPWPRVAGVLVLALVALAYLAANLPAPLQRDGAHFVFMANDIAHGQAPYWASFETKNPLVEMYWSPFLRLLGGWLGLVAAARVAEHVWIAATAALVFLFVTALPVSDASGASASTDNRVRRTWLALAVCTLYLVLALDVRVSDDGLNIALYQALPELVLLALLLRAPAPQDVRRGALVGLAIFAAWFVKQSSLLPAGLMVAATLAVRRRGISRRWWTGVVLGALLPTVLFALHLAATDTWSSYWLGTHEYRASLIPALREDFVANALQAYGVPFWRLDLDAFLAAHRLWTGFATLLLGAASVACLVRRRREGWTAYRTALLLSTSWMLGAWAQAVAGLTFFPHYFLASLAPVATVLALLLVAMRGAAGVAAGVATAMVLATMTWNYRDMRAENAQRARVAPINRSTAQVLPMLAPDDRIFNWSGLPHVLVAHGAPSSYALNMYWPYIMTALPAAERERMLARSLQPPPDVVVAIVEDYPPNQRLASVPMSAGRLEALTGQRYTLVLETPRQAGRYGAPIQVFRRQQGASRAAPR